MDCGAPPAAKPSSGRLARDGAAGGDGQTQLMEVQAHMRERHAVRGIIYEWLFGALGWVAIYLPCRLIKAEMQ